MKGSHSQIQAASIVSFADPLMVSQRMIIMHSMGVYYGTGYDRIGGEEGFDGKGGMSDIGIVQCQLRQGGIKTTLRSASALATRASRPTIGVKTSAFTTVERERKEEEKNWQIRH